MRFTATDSLLAIFLTLRRMLRLFLRLSGQNSKTATRTVQLTYLLITWLIETSFESTDQSEFGQFFDGANSVTSDLSAHFQKSAQK